MLLLLTAYSSVSHSPTLPYCQCHCFNCKSSHLLFSLPQSLSTLSQIAHWSLHSSSLPATMPSAGQPAVAQEEGFNPQKSQKVSCKTILTLAYQSLGVVYGDLSTSPLYVYKTTFSGKLSLHEDDDEVFGVLSFIFWTLTIIPLFKYIFFVLSADDNGEGMQSYLFSPTNNLLMSTYGMDRTMDTQQSYLLKEFFNRHPRSRNWLLTFVLLGTCMAIGDGVLTPAISVLSAVSGVKVKITHLHDNYVVMISCIILIGVFSLQYLGTHWVAFMFAPVVTLWLISISGIGIYNIFRWNPKILCALSPVYMVRFLQNTGVEGWVSLGGVVLCITGAETMFADLGHFYPLSIKITFAFLVYPCLVLAYMGEAAFLSKHHEDIQQSFYKAIPEPVFWPVFIVATFAAVVGSQAVISATFSLVSQCCALSCFPRVKIIHTSKQIYGQIYIPEVNWILMCLCLAVTIGLRNTNTIGHAYGIAVTTVMFVTTCLMSLVIIIVWKKKTIMAVIFVLVFGSVEILYMSASFTKIPEGGWIPLLFAIIFMVVMYTWNYGTLKKHEFDLENKVSTKRILALGPSLGMVRVPGIGIVYADLVTGLPAIFGHFAMNLPAFHQVLVFICVKSVQVPYVAEAERFLIGRIGPIEFCMFRCIVRYGYKDVQQENYDFENRLVAKILEFIEMKGNEQRLGISSMDRALAEFSISDVVHPKSSVPLLHYSCLYEDLHAASDSPIADSQSAGFKESSVCRDESHEILLAKDSGVVYILGHSHAKAKKSSPLLKKFAIDIVFSFLSKNCRGPDEILNVPHSSLLEVGMVYNV